MSSFASLTYQPLPCFFITPTKVLADTFLYPLQCHPLTDAIEHVDMVKFEPEKGIQVDVPIEFFNEEASPGIKKGAVVNQVLRSLRVQCHTKAIPEKILADLANLDVGEKTIRFLHNSRGRWVGG